MAQAIPYLRQGLLSGEQCIYIAEENTKETVLSSLSEGGIDVERAVKERRLVLWNRTDYKPAGPFDRDIMFNFVQGSVEKALAEGFSGLRLAVEMTWAPKSGVTLQELVAWEALLNRLSYPGSKASFICMYNRDLLPSSCSEKWSAQICFTNLQSLLSRTKLKKKNCTGCYPKSPEPIWQKKP